MPNRLPLYCYYDDTVNTSQTLRKIPVVKKQLQNVTFSNHVAIYRKHPGLFEAGKKKNILECYQVSHCRPRLRILAGILEVYSSGPKSIMVPGNRSLGLGLQSVTNVTELKGFVLATHAKGDTNRSLQKTK